MFTNNDYEAETLNAESLRVIEYLMSDSTCEEYPHSNHAHLNEYE